MSATGMGQETGVLFLKVTEQSEAHKAGFQEGDVLIRWNGQKVHTVSDLFRFEEPNPINR